MASCGASSSVVCCCRWWQSSLLCQSVHQMEQTHQGKRRVLLWLICKNFDFFFKWVFDVNCGKLSEVQWLLFEKQSAQTPEEHKLSDHDNSRSVERHNWLPDETSKAHIIHQKHVLCQEFAQNYPGFSCEHSCRYLTLCIEDKQYCLPLLHISLTQLQTLPQEKVSRSDNHDSNQSHLRCEMASRSNKLSMADWVLYFLLRNSFEMNPALSIVAKQVGGTNSSFLRKMT